MTNLFPIIQPKLSQQGGELPLFCEVAWDYKTDTPLWVEGSPAMVSGAEAVAVWAYNALYTVRYRHEIYTWDYGCELDGLIGSGYTEELQQSEAARYVRECLLVCPYLREVSDIKVMFGDGQLDIGCKLHTIYGEVNMNV